ncbi:hypothetical protein ACIQAA_27945 [Neobacillus sp. NPDC093182]|uniref:hypothetical protein n=1 Tax=Neobacillus sp. NPDC093182 TaxID=3364297 RepID=UPI0038291F1D
MNKDLLEEALKEKFTGLNDFSTRYLNEYKIYFISSLVKVENVNKFILNPILDVDLHIKDYGIYQQKKNGYNLKILRNFSEYQNTVSFNDNDGYIMTLSVPMEFGIDSSILDY